MLVCLLSRGTRRRACTRASVVFAYSILGFDVMPIVAWPLDGMRRSEVRFVVALIKGRQATAAAGWLARLELESRICSKGRCRAEAAVQAGPGRVGSRMSFRCMKWDNGMRPGWRSWVVEIGGGDTQLQRPMSHLLSYLYSGTGR